MSRAERKACQLILPLACIALLGNACRGETAPVMGGPNAADAAVAGDAAVTTDGAGAAVDDAGLPPAPEPDPDPLIPIVPEGLVAYFPLDDATGVPGTMASDVSPSALVATYSGTMAAPAACPPAPTVIANPSGARFSAADKQSIRVPNAPAMLEPTQTLSVAAWFRTAKKSDMDVVSMGDSYGLRVGGNVAFFTRTKGTWIMCVVGVTVHDDVWHHVAAVEDTGVVTLYVDGLPSGPPCLGLPPIDYDRGGDLWVGQHGFGGDYSFEGDLDDVRIYDRALSANEVARLARRRTAP